MKKEIFIDIIAYAFILLFVYTGVNKLISYDFFYRDLHRTPYLSAFALPISILVPASELIIAGLLLFNRTRLYGFSGAFVLMTLFTFYVGYVLAFSPHKPCTCGGIIRELSWKNHMLLNTTYLLLSISGIVLRRNKIFTRNKRGMPKTLTIE